MSPLPTLAAIVVPAVVVNPRVSKGAAATWQARFARKATKIKQRKSASALICIIGEEKMAKDNKRKKTISWAYLPNEVLRKGIAIADTESKSFF
jgi:hypothetical protein